MTEVAFTVEGRPRGKQRHRSTKAGRQFTPKQTAEAERAIAWAYKAAAKALPLMTGTVRLDVEAVFRVPKSWSAADRHAALSQEFEYTGKPDADNILKLVKDALNGVAYVDDSQVHPNQPVRRYGEPERIEVRLREEKAQGRKSPAERRREKKVASGMVGAKAPKRRLERNSSASELLAIGKRIR